MHLVLSSVSGYPQAHLPILVRSSQEGDGTVLDHSLVFYGSSNSQTHNNSNYPLVLAGGNQLGIRHGNFHKLSDKTPLANLFVTMLNRLDVQSESFADSTGELTDVLSPA